MKINFKLNSIDQSINIRPDIRLSYVLEHIFKLGSMRIACRKGLCGSCLVLLNGNPVNSCLVPLYKVREQSIQTAEGLKDTLIWKILEESFMIENVHLCSYCAPSRSLSIYALISDGKRPGDEQIEYTLDMVKCRCTAQAKLKQGVERAINMKMDENDF